MPSRFLRELFPESVTFDKKSYVLLKDRSFIDTEEVATGDTRTEFFESKSGKETSEANYHGDQSLVREKNLFMILQLSFYPRIRMLDHDEWLSVYRRGFFELKVSAPEEVTVDEDVLANIAGHVGEKRYISQDDHGDSAGLGAIDRRTYLITENKFVPGGRSFQFVVNWPEGAASAPGAAAVASGNGLLVATDFCVEVYGAEYEERK